MKSDSDIVRRAGRVFTPALHLYYPFSIVRGEGVHVVADDGKRYLDFSSGLGVLNIGHNHPRIVAAAKAQMERFVHTGGIYFNEATVRAAEQLLSVTPRGIDMLFFSNSGAEAVEGALKLARHVSGRQGIISFTRAFHGRTLGAVSITTSSSAYRRGYHPLIPSVYQAPYPYCYRCRFGNRPESCGLSCLGFLEDILAQQIPAEEVAAIIIEPFLGEGGYFPAPASFLRALRELCERHGILLIFDEVQSGMGRTGRWFAAEHSGVEPDIMTIAKGIASGFPLSAVAAGRGLMERWPPGAHGTTFGGNPVSCAACSATIEVIRDEGLLELASRLGAAALERLRQFAVTHPLVGQVRGFGYMIGIEFVDDDGVPNGAACAGVLEHCLKQGLILIGCGLERNVIRFIPPLTATRNQLEQALGILEEGIAKLS